jgi:molybdopterin synthase catalytic subunit
MQPAPLTAAGTGDGDPSLQLSLHAEPFEPWALLAAWEASTTQRCHAPPAATALFIGRVRGSTAAGEPLEALELEHYPGMTEDQIHRLAASCAERHHVVAVLVAHRVGRVLSGEAIVLLAVAADRRGPAQRCCAELLEALKHEAPFWKREWSGGRGVWVEGNTPLG